MPCYSKGRCRHWNIYHFVAILHIALEGRGGEGMAGTHACPALLRPVTTLTMSILRSSDPEARSWPSPLKLTERTGQLWQEVDHVTIMCLSCDYHVPVM